MSTVPSTVGKFVWCEQVSSDPKQAQDFYTQLFGWSTEVFKPGEVDYTMISSRGQSHGGFGKAMEGAPPPHWLSHIRVERLDDAIEKATRAGGKVAGYASEGFGSSAFVRDDGVVYYAYSAQGRGVEFLMGYDPILDRVPMGPDEGDSRAPASMLWIRRKDE